MTCVVLCLGSFYQEEQGWRRVQSLQGFCMDEALHLIAAWLDTPDLEVMEACAWGVRWMLAVPKRVRDMDAPDWVSIQSPVDPSIGGVQGSPLRLNGEIEPGPNFRERQRRLRCPLEGLFAHAAEWHRAGGYLGPLCGFFRRTTRD